MLDTTHPARGDHLCGVYETDAQWEQLVSAYVAAGLAGGNRVCYFTSERTPETVKAVLAKAVSVDAAVKADALRVVAGAYGEFNPEAMMAGLASQIDQAKADGFAGIRFLGEMGWADHEPRLEEYENLVTAYYRDRAVDGICLYDKRRFTDEQLDRLTGLHPTVIETI